MGSDESMNRRMSGRRMPQGKRPRTILGFALASLVLAGMYGVSRFKSGSAGGHPLSIRRSDPVPSCDAADATLRVYISNQSFSRPLAIIGTGLFGPGGFHPMEERVFDVERQHSWHAFHYAPPVGSVTFVAYEVRSGACSSSTFTLREGEPLYLFLSYVEGERVIPFSRPHLSLHIRDSPMGIL